MNYERVLVDDSRGAATAGDDLQENPPPCFKLIVECWELILDHLSLEDILTLSQTCKPMLQLAGCYFREHFSNYIATWNSKIPPGTFGIHDCDVPYNFIPFVQRFNINHNLNYTTVATAKIPRIRTVFLLTGEPITTNVVHARNVLKNAEMIEVEFEKDSKLFEQLADFCPNLKCLSMVVEFGTASSDIFGLFSQYFPSLEYLALVSVPKRSIIPNDNVKSFLEKHSKLKHFQADYRFLCANRDVLAETNIQLDSFGIDFVRPYGLDRFSNFLKKLHARGFYKTLHLSFDYESWTSFPDTIFTLPALESLHHVSILPTLDTSRFANLKEMVISAKWNMEIKDMEILAKNLTNIERLRVRCFVLDFITPFICYSKRLKTLEADSHYDENEYLDLYALNEERKKLGNACQVSVGLCEFWYLRTKWKSNVSYFSHIKITRIADTPDLFLVPIGSDHIF